MRVFRALLIDAYRQLSAAKLFWLTLVLSSLVVVAYGSIGFNDEGISILFGLFEIESKQLTAGSPWARGLYIGIYSNFLVTIWLAWIATVLALISTCSRVLKIREKKRQCSVVSQMGVLENFYNRHFSNRFESNLNNTLKLLCLNF